MREWHRRTLGLGVLLGCAWLIDSGGDALAACRRAPCRLGEQVIAGCCVGAPIESMPPAGTAVPCPGGGGMMLVRGGLFAMGSAAGPAEERPEHRVNVPTFCMDTTEVTVADYRRCVLAGRCATPTESDARCNWSKPARGSHPINCVKWSEADGFCRWAGKALPTEEQWEYAARGGSLQLQYPWGTAPPAARACWNGEGNDAGAGNRQSTCPVGAYAAGPFGLKDMSGNVWEWMSSYWKQDYNAAPQLTRVRRGGGWSSVEKDSLKGSHRTNYLPSQGVYFLGFRCAKTP